MLRMNPSYSICVPPMLGVSFTGSSAVCISSLALGEGSEKQGLMVEVMLEQLPQDLWGVGLHWASGSSVL